MIKKKKYLSIFILFAFMFGLVPVLPVIGVDITQLKIEIDKTTIEENERISAEAYLIYTDGSSKRVTSAISWQSQDSTIAEVDKSGYITGKSAGTTRIDVIYTTPDMSVYSDQIQITVTPINYIPYSVSYSPADGLLEPYEPIVMQFPVDVEITSDYYDLSGKNCGYKLYQDQDKTKVYIKLVLHPDYQPLFPDITQLPWSTINSRINYITDDFKDYIKPVGGKWQYAGGLTAYNFKSKRGQPLTLLGTYPQNNSTLYNKTLMGNTGKALNSILAPDEGANIPLVFLFNKPLKAGDISKFRIESTSPIGGITGHWSSFDTCFYDFASYIVMPQPIYNYAVYGYNLTDVTATMTLEPGALEIVETGEHNTESYSTTYKINPSIAETPDKSALILGENKPNKPELPLKNFTGGELKKVWEFNDPVINNRLLNSGIMFENNIVFGGKNYIYAVNHHNGTLAWKLDSGVTDTSYWIKPYANSNGIIYYLDYEVVPNELLSKYQPYLIAINQDGSFKFKRKLPTTTDKTYSDVYITPNNDVIVIFTGTTLGGIGTRAYFIARYSPDGELKSMGMLGDTFIESSKSPNILLADNDTVIINDMLDNSISAINLPQSGTFNEFTPVWNTAKIPTSDYLKVEKHNGSLLVYQYNNRNVYEINISNGNTITHSLPAVKTFNMQVGPILKDGKFYTADGNIYDIASKTTSTNFTSVKIPTEWDKPEKYVLLGFDASGKAIYVFSKKLNDKGTWKVQFHIGGEDWLDSNVIWESEMLGDDIYFGSEPRVYDFFIGSIILDTQHSLIKLDSTDSVPVPVIPPVTPEPPKEEPKENPKDPPSGGGGTTPEPPVEPEPEPEVIEPEPEVVEPTPEPEEPKPEPEEPKPEPEEPKPEPEPTPVVEPVITETPAKAPAPPRVIEYKEPEPLIKGVVRGIVMLSNGKPLANTRLELHSKPLSTYTNSKGEYIFMDVPLGNHKLYIADIRVSDEKILLQNLTIDNEGKVHSIPISQVNSNKLAQVADIELSAEKPEQIVNMVVDYTLLQEPKKPIWPWLLPLLLPLLIRRRRRKQLDN